MKITKIATRIVNLPFESTITTAIHKMSSVGCVLLTIETDEGIEGQSYLFSLNASNIHSFDEKLKKFERHLIGKDPHLVEVIWQEIWQVISSVRDKHISISALSTIDTAIWDIVGKTANLPLHRLFGACREKIKTYASGGLWLSQPIDSLLKDAQNFLDQGFRSMKIRVGKTNWKNDVERVKEVRNAVGPDIELMADINQALEPKQAIQLGKKLEEYDLLWLEEPVASNNREGHAEVRSALATPIASGENEYSLSGMREMIEAKACDILMPDLQRIGGISEMRKVANLAESYNLPISTHIFTEHSLSVAGSVTNCLSVEHMPWFSKLFNEQIDVINGYIYIPERPGTGFTFNDSYIKQFII